MNVRAEKTDEKKGVICLVSMFPSWFMVLKLAWKVNLLQFNADLSNKFKSVKAVYIYASERSRYALSENDFVHYSMSTVSEILKAWSRQILLNCCWVSIFFDILIANISWTVAQTPINRIIFWKCNENFQMHIYKLLSVT